MDSRLDYDEAVTITINPLSLSLSSWNLFVQNLWQLFSALGCFCRNEFMDSFGKFLQTPTQHALNLFVFGVVTNGIKNAGSKYSLN